MGRVNRRIVSLNVAEAREELQRIEREIAAGTAMPDWQLQIWLEHAYHHLNVAWNARSAPMARYRNMTDRDFNSWAQFPRDIEIAHVTPRSKSKSASNPPFQRTRGRAARR
jgi:hypothetical protein